MTRGHRLAARFVIHTVGPVWNGGRQGEPDLLRGCYVGALRLAAEHGLRSIAFPAISTGAYGYPIELAARVAVDAVRAQTATPTSLELVRFVCFSERDWNVYLELLRADRFRAQR
jgi:O-acetyl-ADP-ribose deacetylase (regulator of RNase III)